MPLDLRIPARSRRPQMVALFRPLRLEVLSRCLQMAASLSLQKCLHTEDRLLEPS
jgi:hypothetical protein